MKIRILGAGWYGCSLALGLIERGHEVELHEIKDTIFSGASGGNPARLHLGFHYPRSRLTRAFCQEHNQAFMERYGHVTSSVPVNIYAVASQESLIDFGTYCQILKGEVEFVTIDRPEEFDLRGVEGAILTGERHIVIRKAKALFEEKLRDHIRFESPPGAGDGWDWTIDCTFCANDAENIDRYEPCITALLEGPTDKAVTIMDGPFPSLYPWDEENQLSSLTSAKFTPLCRCETWKQADNILRDVDTAYIQQRCQEMLDQISKYYRGVKDLYSIADWRLSIRAQPKSAADARLVDIVRVGERILRVRAGKIDAVLHAEKMIAEMIGCLPLPDAEAKLFKT